MAFQWVCNKLIRQKPGFVNTFRAMTVVGGVLARSDSGSASGSAEGHSSLDDFAADVRELDPSSPVFGNFLFCLLVHMGWQLVKRRSYNENCNYKCHMQMIGRNRDICREMSCSL